MRSLAPVSLKNYETKVFICGWTIEIEERESQFRFNVLLDSSFPFSPIRVALPDDSKYLQWPHVEDHGVLCLPETWVPAEDLESAIKTSLIDAIDLVKNCRSDAFIAAESKKEFISYWNRGRDVSAGRLRSLLDADNGDHRFISLWRGKKYIVVGENDKQISQWLDHSGIDSSGPYEQAVYLSLNEGPGLPLPQAPKQFLDILGHSAPGANSLLSRLSPFESNTFVLGAPGGAGKGLFGGYLRKVNQRGFRKGRRPPLKIISATWKRWSTFSRISVDRYDPGWVHGRGVSVDQNKLFDSHVVVLGCGSLGSHVAVRLAQLGIGSLTLIDPEDLAASNVGRHALGIENVGYNKADKLALHLQRRFPHLRSIRPLHERWEEVADEPSSALYSADLIISCIGEWSSEANLSAWHRKTFSDIPVIYGWLGSEGATSHAVLVRSDGPSLRCLLAEDGNLKVAEATFQNTNLIQTEPACGTQFQPYGPLDVGHAELLVSRLCVDAIRGMINAPVHRVQACSTPDLIELGGVWSKEHLEMRPEGYQGPIQFDRTFQSCGTCGQCR
tara:strand:+ start:17697 stop:19370 length:1674 start_codon:yes stop_codon:yes gene_type:complete